MTTRPLYILIIFLLSCSNKNTQTERNEIKTEEKEEPQIDQATKFKIIDKWNDRNYIYKGTATYDSILTNYKKLKFTMDTQSKLLTEAMQGEGSYRWLFKRDTVFFIQTKDTIKINRWFLSTAHCWQYYPFIYEHSDTLDIFYPEQTEGDVQIENGDTVKTSEACPTETIIDIVVSVPYDKKYKNKILRFENRTYKIK